MNKMAVSDETSLMSSKAMRKRRDLAQSNDKSPFTHSKEQCYNTQTPPKSSITQQLRTDLGRSVGVTIATHVVKSVYGIPTFPLTVKAV